MATQVVLLDVRALFPELFEINVYKNSRTWRSSFITPKEGEAAKAIEAAIITEAKAKWPKLWEKKLRELKPQKISYPLKDGDETEYESQQDSWILTAVRRESQGRAAVVDRNKVPLVSPDGKESPDARSKIYSGVRCNATVEFWAQDGENQGIRCSLINWQFFKHSAAFGGGAPATDSNLPDFGYDDEDEEEDDLA